jgi:membrane protease subunit HflC
VNTDASQVRIADFEAQLRQQIDQQLLTTYGVRVLQVGIERLTLPSVTLTATVDRMRAERETIATERTAIGKREAAQIRSAAERDARIVQADATVKAADIEAQSGRSRADLWPRVWVHHSCTTCCARSIPWALWSRRYETDLRTDAAPFRVLVDGPPTLDNKSGSQP